MTSLLGKLLRLFPESVPLEDLFTEALARLFETRPRLCISWLEEVGLITAHAAGDGQEYVRVASQKPFASLEHHDTDSRPDLVIEVYRAVREESAEDGGLAEAVVIESKIGSKEGPNQLKRYAEHLDRMVGFSSKALVYITRGYDPKEPNDILSRLGDNVRFEQLRWHDFYRFLQTVEKDALVEEVMAFMEEQGMARSYRFSTTDLMALSGVPRAFEILDETFDGEVRAELESFAGNKISKREPFGLPQIRQHQRYIMLAPLHLWDLYCYVGYRLRTADGYPVAFVILEAPPGTPGKDISVAAMKSIARRESWETYNLDDSAGYATAARSRSLVNLLSEEDHVAAVKAFFIESIHQLREELTAFKKEHPDLPWAEG